MSEIQNNQGPFPADNTHYGHETHQENQQGITFRGEQTDLGKDPMASVKRTWINKQVRATVGNQTVSFGAKELANVKKDLDFLAENPKAVEKAAALFPAFQGYAKANGSKNPDALALALENYAATNEFIANTELDLD